MAHSRSAKEKIRSSARKTEQNKPIKTQTKSSVAKADKLIQSGDLDAAEKAIREASGILDKASRKNVIHPNAAARRKSHLARSLKAAKSKATDPKSS